MPIDQTSSLEINEDTQPTLDDVRERLEAGKLAQKDHNISYADLYTQLTEITAPALRHEKHLESNGYPGIRVYLIEGYRLAELGGFAEAARLGIILDTSKATSAQAALRARFIARRDAFVRMARDSEVDERYFLVNFGEGNAVHILKPAQTLLNLVKLHGAKLNNPILVKRFSEDLTADIKGMRNEDIKQEHGKYTAKQPTKFSVRASEALYANLLHINRAGFNSFVDNKEVQEEFALKVFRGGSKTTAVGDNDDAPIIPPGVDPEAPVAPGPLPSGNND